MKVFVKHAVLFVLFSVSFSGLAGCSNPGGTGSSNGNGDQSNNASAQQQQQQQANSGNSGSGGEKTSGSEYPPVAEHIMQAKLETVEGSNFTLQDKKGKVVLINLWGIWCQPCIKEMPHLVELQNQYRDQGLEIIGLNVGDEDLEKESADNIRKFSEKMSLNYQLGYADDKFYADLVKISKFGGVPQSFLIDRGGRLNGVYKGASPPELAKMKDNIKNLMSAK